MAFMPRTPSKARRMAVVGRQQGDADDDGVAIFWRAAAFTLAEGGLSFLVFEEAKCFRVRANRAGRTRTRVFVAANRPRYSGQITPPTCTPRRSIF